MEHQRNSNLMTKVFVIGLIIAILSYLFHPDVGQFSIMMNGEPVADPLVRFAAIPTFLVIMLITGVDGYAVFRGWRFPIYGRPIHCIFWVLPLQRLFSGRYCLLFS